MEKDKQKREIISSKPFGGGYMIMRPIINQGQNISKYGTRKPVNM